MKKNQSNKPRERKSTEGEFIFRSTITTKSGKVLFARDYGLRAWKIRVTK